MGNNSKEREKQNKTRSNEKYMKKKHQSTVSNTRAEKKSKKRMHTLIQRHFCHGKCPTKKKQAHKKKLSLTQKNYLADNLQLHVFSPPCSRCRSLSYSTSLSLIES